MVFILIPYILILFCSDAYNNIIEDNYVLKELLILARMLPCIISFLLLTVKTHMGHIIKSTIFF